MLKANKPQGTSSAPIFNVYKPRSTTTNSSVLPIPAVSQCLVVIIYFFWLYLPTDPPPCVLTNPHWCQGGSWNEQAVQGELCFSLEMPVELHIAPRSGSLGTFENRCLGDIFKGI